MSNIKIDLIPLFKKLEKESYCIIKLPDNFPSYDVGSDLDFFCYNIEKVSRIILGCLQSDISDDLSVIITNMGKQIYIDIMDKRDIHFRFDLYGSLPSYQNVSIKDAFFSSVIEGSNKVEKSKCIVKIPKLIDESILRYIEYQEWFSERPDKIKHINYLEEKFQNSELELNKVLDKLHYYISIPRIKEDEKINASSSIQYMQYLYGNFKKIIKYIQLNGLERTIYKIKDRLSR